MKSLQEIYKTHLYMVEMTQSNQIGKILHSLQMQAKIMNEKHTKFKKI
jgi:hypothetical protein